MSVRQYIGARYVPRFSDVNGGVWSNVYSYEPLTIVKNGNDYYTSKQSVPVGIQINNTDYWVKTGDYNGAIQRLDEEIQSLNNEVDENADKIDRINDIVSNQHRNIVLVGDSYGTKNGSSVTLNKDVGDALQYMINTSNGNVVNISQNGAGFCNGRFLTNITAYKSTLTEAECLAVTDIFVFGGWNDTIGRDGQTTSQLETAMRAFNTYVKENFPNAKLYLGFVSYTKNATSEADGLNTTYQYYTISYNQGFIFCDLHNVIARSDLVVADGVHPNADGVVWIARGIYEFIMKGSFSFNARTYATITFDTGFASGGCKYIDYEIDQQNLRMKLYNRYINESLRIAFPSDVTGNLGRTMTSIVKKVGTIDKYYGNAGDKLKCPIVGHLLHGSPNVYDMFMGYLYCDGLDVYIVISNVDCNDLTNELIGRATFSLSEATTNQFSVRSTT